MITQSGELKTQILGNPLLTENACFQAVIKAGDWFAVELHDQTSFALMGRVASPGLKSTEYALTNRKLLASQYSKHAFFINRLTKTETANNFKAKIFN